MSTRNHSCVFATGATRNAVHMSGSHDLTYCEAEDMSEQNSPLHSQPCTAMNTAKCQHIVKCPIHGKMPCMVECYYSLQCCGSSADKGTRGWKISIDYAMQHCRASLSCTTSGHQEGCPGKGSSMWWPNSPCRASRCPVTVTSWPCLYLAVTAD